MMMDYSAPTHERRKIVNTYKPIKIGLWFLKYAERPFPKIMIIKKYGVE